MWVIAAGLPVEQNDVLGVLLPNCLHPVLSNFSNLLCIILVCMCRGAVVVLLAVSVQRCCTGLNIETPLRPCSVYSLSDEPA